MTTASTSFAFCELPSEVLASVLCDFSQGKAISTFLVVARGNAALRLSALKLCRGALVQRYVKLSAHMQHYEEIRDVLDIIREDIRLSEDDDDTIITKFSEWCAILDYFETQLVITTAASYRRPQWVVWSGRLEIQYGEIEAFLSTPDWTVGAMHYWRTAELANMTVTHPRNSDFHFTQDRIPYGSLFGMNELDRRRLGIQSRDIEVSVLRDSVEARRHSLVPLSEVYDENPSAVFVDHSFVSRTHESVPVGPLLIAPGRESLCCCWDKELGEDDWEEAVASLGKHAIRIMSSFVEDGVSFSEKLSEHYRNKTEFSNSGVAY
jgi:hypothetical protein